MATNYAGYLIKVRNTNVPLKYIKFDTFKSTPNQITSVDTFTDADGLLHETPAPHTSTKVEFQTPPLYLEDKIALQAIIPMSTTANRRNVSVTYWNDCTNDYVTGTFYIPDVNFDIMREETRDGTKTLLYNPIRIAFIEY